MKVNVEKLEGNQAKLTIEVPAQTFEQSMDKAYRQVVKKITIHGFRKGKAPRQVVERMYGREILLEDAINDAIPPAFTQAMTELSDEYACTVYPKYDVVSSEKGEGLVFTATYDLKPEVQLGVYKGMELEKLDDKPEEGAVERQLDAMRERFARLEKSTEPAALGDVCTIDFLGKVDDEPFEGGEGKDVPLELGSNSFVPGFEEQLVGADIGDEVDVNITFPTDYRVDELAGKDAVFHVLVKEIKHKFLSEMDDEFAKDVSEFETIDELRKDIEDKIDKEIQERVQNDLEAKAIEKAMREATIELPDSMISYRQDLLVENLASQMGRQGLEFSKYLEYMDLTVDTFRDDLRERAIRELKTEYVLEAVAAQEGIEVCEADMDSEYQRMAGQTGRAQEEIKKLYDENKSMADSLTFSLMMNKTIKFLVENSTILTQA